MDGEASLPARRLLVRSLATFVGIATLAACLTVLFLGKRLADLHRQGALSDAEFAAAKQALLGGV